MAHSRKDEARALDAGERELVDKTHHPVLQDLADGELSELLKRVRERRDKAQDAASRQRREMRRKGDPKGTRPAAGDTGTRRKVEVLAMAVRRLNSERDRRQRLAAKADLVDNAQRALALRQAAGSDSSAPASRNAGQGMQANENSRARKTVAPKKIGSVSQQTKRAQAKRDAG